MTEKPFEDILGNTYKLRIIEFMLPLNDIEYSIEELSKTLNISEKNIRTALLTFYKWKMFNRTVSNNIELYSINKNSQIMNTLQDFNLAIIDLIINNDLEQTDKNKTSK